MLTVRSRRQQKVRVLCCCWFSRQPAPLHTRQDEQARAESLTLARSTGQLAVLSIPHAYCSEWLVSLATLTSRSGANPKRNKPSGHVFQIWAEPCRYGGLCASGRLLSIIAKLFLRKTFSTKLAARRKGPIYSFKMSLQEKLDKIRSPKLQNQHQVVLTISKPF
jgi:hypothetical protein